MHMARARTPLGCVGSSEFYRGTGRSLANSGAFRLNTVRYEAISCISWGSGAACAIIPARRGTLWERQRSHCGRWRKPRCICGQPVRRCSSALRCRAAPVGANRWLDEVRVLSRLPAFVPPTPVHNSHRSRYAHSPSRFCVPVIMKIFHPPGAENTLRMAGVRTRAHSAAT